MKVDKIPFGASWLEHLGKNYTEHMVRGTVVRVLKVGERASVVAWKDEGYDAGPVFIDGVPYAEKKYVDSWTASWMEKDAARKLAEMLGAKFEEV